MIGIGSGRVGYGAGGPPNAGIVSGANPVTSNTAKGKRLWETGPFWVIVFLIVGWIMVYQTLR